MCFVLFLHTFPGKQENTHIGEMIFCVICVPQRWAECAMQGKQQPAPTQLTELNWYRYLVSAFLFRNTFFKVLTSQHSSRNSRLNLAYKLPASREKAHLCQSMLEPIFKLQKGAEEGKLIEIKTAKGKKCAHYNIFFFATVGPVSLLLKNFCNFQKCALGLCALYSYYT